MGDIVKNTISTSVEGDVLTNLPDAYFDAFGRLRTSEVTSLIDLKQTNDNLPLFYDEEIIGGGTSVHSTAEARSRLTVSSNNDAVIRQTKQRFNYESGKSQLVEMTSTNFQPQTNVIKRIGYFSSNTTTPFNSTLDGLYFESSSGEVSVNVAKSGAITSVSQDSWNLDKLDGTGESGINIDWSKGQIFLLDFQWLGVGRVRWALDINGHIIYFHETNNANNVDGVYISNPNQPVRYEIRSTGGIGTLDHICSSVETEGSRNNLGKLSTYNIGSTPYKTDSSGNKVCVFSLRLRNGYEDVTINILDLVFLAIGGKSFCWELHFNANLPIGTYNTIPNSSLEVAKYANQTLINSDGYIISSGYVFEKSQANKDVKNAVRLGSSIAGVQDVLTLVINPIENDVELFASINLREVL